MEKEEEFTFEWEERDDNTSFKVHMLAGSIAGLSEHILLLPLDNLKTHIQTTTPSLKNAFLQIRRHGFTNFYRGTTILMMGCIPSHALFFSNYEIFKKYFIKEGEISIFSNMALGGFSTLFHDIIMTPTEMIKQRSQILKNQSNLSIISNTLKNEGFLSFWKAFPVNLFSNLPSQMITVSANENLKTIYKNYFGHISFSGYFLCAGLAGIISSIFTTPLDNIKTRLNVQQIHKEEFVKQKKNIKIHKTEKFKNFSLKRAFLSTNLHKCSRCETTNNSIIKYPNAMCAVKIIKAEEGFKGFFKGLSLRMTSQSLSAAISWTVYEMGKNFLIKKNFK